MSKTNHWQNKPLTILGLSKSGAAVARYVQARGGDCLLSENAPATPNNEPLRTELEKLGVTVETGGHSKRCFTHSETVVVSPGIPPSSSVIEQLTLSNKNILSEVELAYRENQREQSIPMKSIPMIGVTGTNGKSTVVTLLSDILTQAGHNAPACGNIGTPIIEVLDTKEKDKTPNYLVAELSSFQLHFSPTLRSQIAVFTNFRPDHLDWHGSVDNYKQDKLRLFTGQQSPDWAVINADDPVSQTIADNTTAQCVWTSLDQNSVAKYPNHATLNNQGQVVIQLKDKDPVTLFTMNQIAIIGQHNHANVLQAAVVAHLLDVPTEIIEKTSVAFKGLPHRLEYVATLNGSTIYNDSKATNPDATIPALNAFPNQHVVLIAGGYDKNSPLEELSALVQKQTKAVILIGEASKRFKAAFESAGTKNIHLATTLGQALTLSIQLSQGDPVLFSPACASFGMFKNFEARGNAFKELVAQQHSITRRTLT